MKEYFLRQGVFLYGSAESVIVFDVRKNLYLGLGKRYLNALRAYSSDLYTFEPTSTPRDNFDGTTMTLLNQLVTDRILTNRPARAHWPIRLKLEVPEEALVDLDFASPPAVHKKDILAMFYATLRTRLAFKWRRLSRNMDSIRRRKVRFANGTTSLDHLRRLTAIHHHLRPFSYSHHDQCLLDSMAFVEFLSLYGLYPTLVVGVKDNPFGAHAWVQEGNYVLTSTPWYVKGFTPIFAV